ncbi:hypothetical protein [Alkalicoccus daliensis]|uniref:GNAT family N-acetyltransferase n=1 Tax=Alkalicoccus daliensis TaxID=745820 RepID=A0A1H0D4W9_9BACI|nr:hypothetical protein [Alkalicoccus daliensis]SDN65188.1 hypothetical protein SAMN04488053_102344 [Alkalicoccus daliensis]
MRFKTIHPTEHKRTVLEFRKDSFRVSFGDTSGFGEEAAYLYWLEKKVSEFPAGFVLIEDKGNFIGQLELSIRAYEGQKLDIFIYTI